MKYIYLTFLCLLFLVQSGSGQQRWSETVEMDQLLSPSLQLPFPTDKVLGPSSGPTIRVGLFGGIISNSHSGTFTVVEDGILCCEFDGASSVGPTVALRGEFSPDEKAPWGVALRIAWEDQSAEFESKVEQLLIFGEDNQPENADFQNQLDATLTGINIAPLFMYKLVDLDLYVSAGPAITLFSSPSFDKTERILGPTGVTYLDGTTELSFPDIPIEGVGSSLFSIMAGLDLRYPITEQIAIGSELYYRHPLTNITSDEEWTVSNLIATIGVSFAL